MASRPNQSNGCYGSRWQKARAAFLRQPGNQFCIRCYERGLLNAGNLRMDGSPQTVERRIHLVVDHIIPHKGDQKLFWDRKNWQVLCPDHHDIAKQQEEHGKIRSGTDTNGRPLDPNHPWNRR